MSNRNVSTVYFSDISVQRFIIINAFWNKNHKIDGNELHFTWLADEETDVISENRCDAV